MFVLVVGQILSGTQGHDNSAISGKYSAYYTTKQQNNDTTPEFFIT